MADGNDESKKPIEGVVVQPEAEDIDLQQVLAATKDLLSTKSAETLTEAFGKVMVAKASTEGEKTKLDHALQMDAQKRRMIVNIVGLVVMAMLIGAMVTLVQFKILDESTIQKIAIVVLALLSAAATRVKT